MRHLLLALPFALLPLVNAHAADAHDHAHGSLGTHEHGVAQINAALEGKTLELELSSPAMNIVGFEHAASSDEDKAKLATAKETLLKPHGLFSIPEAAGCVAKLAKVTSPLYGDKDDDGDDDDHDHDAAGGHEHEHSDIHGHYQFACETPAVLNKLDLTQLFKAFPATHSVRVQLITPKRQLGAEVKPANPIVNF